MISPFFKIILRMLHNYQIYIKGLVQGVGFRPFIYKMASEMELTGSVEEQRQILISGVNRFFHWFFLLLNSHGFSPCYVEDCCFAKQKDPHSIPMLSCIGDYVSASLKLKIKICVFNCQLLSLLTV